MHVQSYYDMKRKLDSTTYCLHQQLPFRIRIFFFWPKLLNLIFNAVYQDVHEIDEQTLKVHLYPKFANLVVRSNLRLRPQRR